jgi:hypothetical protein
MRILTFVLAISPLLAAGKADFGLWTPSEIKQRESALAKKVGPDHSARETVRHRSVHAATGELCRSQIHLQEAIWKR